MQRKIIMSVIDKLKLNKYTNMVVINEPSEYDIFTGKETSFSKEHDAIFIFVETLDEMVKQTNFIISNEELLIEKGYVFFAYPKKAMLVTVRLFTVMRCFRH